MSIARRIVKSLAVGPTFLLLPQDVVGAVVEAQSRAGGEATVVVEIAGVTHRLSLQRAVMLPELRRHKRAFLKLATQNNWIRLREAADARCFFVEYLQNNLE